MQVKYAKREDGMTGEAKKVRVLEVEEEEEARPLRSGAEDEVEDAIFLLFLLLFLSSIPFFSERCGARTVRSRISCPGFLFHFCLRELALFFNRKVDIGLTYTSLVQIITRYLNLEQS
jgi:hypothetical protein